MTRLPIFVNDRDQDPHAPSLVDKLGLGEGLVPFRWQGKG